MINESIKIPKAIAAIEDLKGPFLIENGNSQITGQHGEIPLIFNQSGEIITNDGKQIIVKNNNNFL